MKLLSITLFRLLYRTAHIRKTQKNEKLYLRDFMAQINKHGKGIIIIQLSLHTIVYCYDLVLQTFYPC